MTNLPMIFLLTVLTTNWVSIPGDWKREGNTNYVKQQLMVVTNVYVAEVTLCTNLTTVRRDQGTNGPVRWTQAMPSLPPLPGQSTRE